MSDSIPANTVTTNPLLDKRIIQAFADSVLLTLNTMTKVTAKLERPSVHQRYRSRGVIAGMIGMVSNGMKGQLTLSFEKEAALIVINSLTNESNTEINDSIFDAIGELTNIVYGEAKRVLNERGYAFQMAIPMVVEGHNAVIPMHNGTTLVLPFRVENHRFYVEIIVQA